MLDKSILSQLSQLKSDIHASKEFAEGTVAGTGRKFGFVRLDDSRDAFLAPDKMERLIPGDRVKVCLTKNDKDQLEANLEELLEPAVDTFVGVYHVRGKTHFVEPLEDRSKGKTAQHSRWLFVPPKARGRNQDGDRVVARLTQHPYKDGKALVKVLESIGQPNSPYFERNYIAAKYQLSNRTNDAIDKQMNTIIGSLKLSEWQAEREDLTNIPFVTIDAATTQDMDDALAVEVFEKDGQQHYRLLVAIADPTAFIEQGSALATSAQYAGQSTYLSGGACPMLPKPLSHDCFSLVQDEPRAALICKLDINSDGEIIANAFSFATIKNHAKLSYQGVADALENNDPALVPEQHIAMLEQLAAIAKARINYRKTHNMVSRDQLDYDIQLDDKGKIVGMSPRTKSLAHQIVEEAMVATNFCAGQLLASKGKGLHSVHSGFRSDRIGEVNALLKEEEITPETDISTLDGYLAFFKSLSNNPDKAHLELPLRRMMPTSELSLRGDAHMGMGLSAYATVTSPIRRFADLYNHWALRSCLTKSTFTPLNDASLERLRASIDETRKADRELTQWLISQYAQTQIGTQGLAKIRIVTQQGFGCRLLDLGLDGFVLFPKKQEKSFDAKRMTITVGETTYHLDDEVEVKVSSADLNKRRVAFSLV